MKIDDSGLRPYYSPKVDQAALAKSNQFANKVNSAFPNYQWTSPEKGRQMMLDRTAFINKQNEARKNAAGAQGPKLGAGGAAATPKAINYQTGFNASDQAVNEGHILGRLNAEGGGPSSQFSGVDDLRKSQQFNDAAQLRRGVQQENAQHHMNDQVARSEIMQAATSNMAKMYGDMTQRSIDQMGLATQLQEAMIRNRNALFQSLMK